MLCEVASSPCFGAPRIKAVFYGAGERISTVPPQMRGIVWHRIAARSSNDTDASFIMEFV